LKKSGIKKDLFGWRELIASELGPNSSTTRHVLITLSLRINKKTMCAYPSIRRLAIETGLSERTICTHLEISAREGWIIIERLGKSGRDWRLHNYRAVFPDKVLKQIQHENNEGVERDSAPAPLQGVESLSGGVESPSKSYESPKMIEPSEKEEKSDKSSGDVVLKEVQSNQITIKRTIKEEDMDSKKESYPLKEYYVPSEEQWKFLKRKLGKIGE
jgi:predicted DNA-binding transcriptional regulator